MYSKVKLKKIEKLCKRFCKNAKIKLVFTSDKLRQTLTYKDSYQSVLSSKVVYKFVCASCNACYVGQTHQHLESYIYQHLMSSADCLNACSRDCFSILDTARTKDQESLLICWLDPTLNKQSHTNTSFLCPFDLCSVSSVCPCCILFYCHTPFQTFEDK